MENRKWFMAIFILVLGGGMFAGYNIGTQLYPKIVKEIKIQKVIEKKECPKTVCPISSEETPACVALNQTEEAEDIAEEEEIEENTPETWVIGSCYYLEDSRNAHREEMGVETKPEDIFKVVKVSNGSMSYRYYRQHNGAWNTHLNAADDDGFESYKQISCP